MQALVAAAFPAWTDSARANIGNLLNELSTWNGDVLDFYQSKQFREAFCCWATQRKSMLAHAKLASFTPRSRVAATVDLTLSIPAAVAGDVVLAAGDTFRTKAVTSPQIFQLLAETTITAGSTSATASVENSENETDSFTSDGTPSQEFTLGATPYLDSSAVVTISGSTYTQVEDFLSSTATSKHYRVLVDQNDRAKLIFGDGVNGVIPGNAATIAVTYKTGGGEAGNVEAASITRVDGSYTDSLGTQVVVSCTNSAAASGGEERMSVETMRLLIPASLRLAMRCVSREDFETAATLIPGVARALMITYAEHSGIPGNEGWLYVVPSGGGVPSTALKTTVNLGVTEVRPGPLGFVISVLNPVYLTINVAAKIWIKHGYAAATVAATIRANLATWFAPSATDGTPNTNVDFGCNILNESGDPDGYIALSDIFDVVKDSAGVLRVGTAATDFQLNSTHDNIAISVLQFPALGTVTLTNGATGASL